MASLDEIRDLKVNEDKYAAEQIIWKWKKLKKYPNHRVEYGKVKLKLKISNLKFIIF